MSEVLTPAVNGGVPAAGQQPAGAPQAAPESPAPVEQVQAPVAPNPLEAKLAQVEGQIQAMYQMMSGLQQPQAPVAPVAPQPTLAERIAALGDPVTATDPAAWNAGLAQAMEEEMQNRLAGFEKALGPRLQTLQQIEQERAMAAQTAQISRALKTAHPELANIPDAVIGQRLQQLQDPATFLSFFANDLRGAMSPQTQQQQAQIPAPIQPQPGPGAVLPQGSPNANHVQMQADFHKWNRNGTEAQNARMADPAYFSQVHAAAVANGWGR